MTQGNSGEVIIIGGGIAGLTLAFSLVQRGLKPSIVNFDEDEFAASPATHGISTVKGILESDQPLFGDKLAGHRDFFSWLGSVEDAAGLSRPPAAFIHGIYENFENMENFQKEFGRIYRRDFTGAKRVRHGEATDGFFRCFYPGDWWVDPRHLFKSLRMSLANAGVVFKNDLIQKLSVNSKTKAWVIEGKKATYGANLVVIAAGAGSAALTQVMSDDLEPIFGVSGYTFVAKSDKAMRPLVKGTTGIVQKKDHMHWGSTSDPAVRLRLPLKDLFVAGSSGDSVGKNLLKKLGAEDSVNSIQSMTSRWGVRCRTKARAPVARLWSWQGAPVVLNYGYYKSGMILSWKNAEDLAQLVVKAFEHPSNTNH